MVCRGGSVGNDWSSVAIYRAKFTVICAHYFCGNGFGDRDDDRICKNRGEIQEIDSSRRQICQTANRLGRFTLVRQIIVQDRRFGIKM